MRKLLFLVVFIAMTFPVFSINIQYNRTVREAEISIVKQDFATALKFYSKLSGDSMFAIDIHNAIVCAIILNDELSIQKFGQKLCNLGLPQAYFLKNKAFKRISEKPYWLELSQKSEAIYLINKNRLEPLKKIVDSLMSADQYYNKIAVDKSIARDTVWIRENSLKYENIIKDNSLYLMRTFEQTGFPGNNNVIFYMPNDSVLSFTPVFSASIIHSYQGKRHGLMGTDTFFSPILRKGLESNLIQAETFASDQDNGNLDVYFRNFYGTVHVFVSEGNSLYAAPFLFSDTTTRNKIDGLRKEIGLPTLNEEIERIKFYKFKNEKFGFIFFNTVFTYNGYSIKDDYDLIFEK